MRIKARIKMKGEDACLVAGALMPDNVNNIKTELKEKDGSAIVHLEAPRIGTCLLYTSPSPRDLSTSRMPSSA